ncbi:MAG: hypothetical protein KGI94_05880 [Paracoccaceae bacterium]|nr:hypothetical protein [Paracoccaceae bacterium]
MTPVPSHGASDPMLLSVVLRHDQSRVVGALHEQLERQGYFEQFPPEGVEVVSWYVMMGLGQVVTLRFPAHRLREVNRAIESTAWGAFRTDIHATYDFRAIAREQRQGKLTLAAAADI